MKRVQSLGGASRSAVRYVYLGLGFALLGVGIVGYVLPVLPGTIFIILSAACFAKSCPAFEDWILRHPWFGASVRAWRAEGAMPRGAKLAASAGMGIGAVALVFPPILMPVKAGLWVFLAACLAYVWSRPLPSGVQQGHEPG